MSGGTTCAFRGCRSKYGRGISMFSFPKDPELAEIWLKACYRSDLLPKVQTLHRSTYRLCQLHFEEKFILKGISRKRLFNNAIPSIFPTKIVQGTEITEEKTVDENVSKDNEREPPEGSQKVHILSDIKIVPIKGKKDFASANIPASLDIYYGPSTSKEVICEPLENISEHIDEMEERKIPPPLFSPSIGTQTPLQLSSNSPRKRKLKAELKSLKKSRKTVSPKAKTDDCSLDEFKKMCDMFLDNPLSEIIKSHVTLKKKKRISHRYSAEIKQFALTLHFLSPRAYNYLCKLLTLPTKRSLQRLTEQLFCKPGLDNNAILKALELRTKTMLEHEKHCILCIDEMSLKSNLFYDIGKDEIVGFEDMGNGSKKASICQNALVIMARGLYSPWKQPIAFFFVGSQLKSRDLKPIIEECVAKLASINLNVEAISSDMGSNFLELGKLYNVTPENPEFQVDNHKLLYIFDPCHLVKAARNNLMKHTFRFHGKSTSWKFIQDFYEQDKKQFYRCAPKLTDAHLRPSNFEKMRVKLAVQLLSHTVVCGMNTYMTFGALPAEAFGTIEVIERFNNLFDILNSVSLRNPNKYKRVFDGSKFQIDFLNDSLQFLSELKIINSDNQDISNKIKFHKCWKITINSVMKLWDKLSKVDFMYLKTRRINTDCLENFFGTIRQQGGNCVNPTPIQFSRAFKKLYWQKYLHSENMNCTNDLNTVLLDVKSTNISEIFQSKNQPKPISAVVIPDTSYRRESIPTQNAFTYVCGYLLKKALNIHTNCDSCENYRSQCESLDVNSLLTHYKAYDTTKNIYGALQHPPEFFIKYIYDLEHIFKTKFEDICIEQGVSHKLLNVMEKIEFTHPCPDFPKMYIVKLFIRLKIFYTMKYTNRDLKYRSKDKTKLRKLNILSHI